MGAKQLLEVMNQSDTSKAMFKVLGNRQRYRKDTNIDYFHTVLENKGMKVEMKDLMETFKSLENLGVGTLVHGRGKNPTRFLWNYNLKDIAAAAKGEKDLDDAEKLNGKTPEKKQKSPIKVQQFLISKEKLIKAIELIFSDEN